jgi:hypothetical protein
MTRGVDAVATDELQAVDRADRQNQVRPGRRVLLGSLDVTDPAFADSVAPGCLFPRGELQRLDIVRGEHEPAIGSLPAAVLELPRKLHQDHVSPSDQAPQIRRPRKTESKPRENGSPKASSSPGFYHGPSEGMRVAVLSIRGRDVSLMDRARARKLPDRLRELTDVMTAAELTQKVVDAHGRAAPGWIDGPWRHIQDAHALHDRNRRPDHGLGRQDEATVSATHGT